MSEVVVAKEADMKAFQHVMKNNPCKGNKTPEESKKATTVLFSKSTAKERSIVIHAIHPVLDNRTTPKKCVI